MQRLELLKVGLIISKAIFIGFIFSKSKRIFLWISALASKMTNYFSAGHDIPYENSKLSISQS
jgi:hypothetical protein